MRSAPFRSAGLAAALAAAVAGCSRPGGEAGDGRPAETTHPVFATPVGGRSAWRPALQLDVLDDSRFVFRTARFYLAVQSSRFPADTLVVLPVNVGDFAGCRTRFVQLPFEVRPDDKLLFNLYHAGSLSADDERLILAACRALGFCVVRGIQAYNPVAGLVVSPGAAAAADVLGEVAVSEFRVGTFTNYGTAEYVVPAVLPPTPQQANRLTILDDGQSARADVRLYGPPDDVRFAP